MCLKLFDKLDLYNIFERKKILENKQHKCEILSNYHASTCMLPKNMYFDKNSDFIAYDMVLLDNALTFENVWGKIIL